MVFFRVGLVLRSLYHENHLDYDKVHGRPNILNKTNYTTLSPPILNCFFTSFFTLQTDEERYNIVKNGKSLCYYLQVKSH